jgi:hypothetical protein
VVTDRDWVKLRNLDSVFSKSITPETAWFAQCQFLMECGWAAMFPPTVPPNKIKNTSQPLLALHSQSVISRYLILSPDPKVRTRASAPRPPAPTLAPTPAPPTAPRPPPDYMPKRNTLLPHL